jgi:putative ABC transport system permease protein
MFRNHLKFATRVFLKDKFFSSLNILGLALGIAVSIILLLILQNDLTYDKYHVNHERIFRLGGHLSATGVDFRSARSARELGRILQDELPEVQAFVRANDWDHTRVKYQPAEGGERTFYEENIIRTDSNYFQVFTHEFVAGNPRTCLVDINTLVMTETTAHRYFGDEPALDKTVLVGDDTYKITGVIKDVPENTHLKFDIILSQLPRDRGWKEESGQIKSEAFWNPDVFTYLLMPEHYNPQDFYAKFQGIFDKYFKSFGDQVGGKYEAILEPLASIHFHSDLNSDEPHGNLAYVYAFTGIGIFIILLACINYMNLSTAKSVNRAGEIAMKKAMGSSKQALMLSFLGESILLSFVAFIIAIGLVFFVLQATGFNNLIGRKLQPDFVHNPLLLAGSFGLTLLIGLVSGLYPALILPAIPTIKALKGAYKNQKSSLILRKVLITTQFAISIFVVTCTLFMQRQIDYVRNKELGFEKDNVLVLSMQDTVIQHHAGKIKQELLQNPHIKAVTTAYNVPGMGIGGPVMWAEHESGMKQQAFSMMFVGDDYLKTMGIQLAQGRDFEPGKADIENCFIVNEAAVKLMGWEKDPIGKKVKFFHDKDDKHVVGVVKDFNFASLHNKVEPLLLMKARDDGGYLHVKVEGAALPATINYIRDKWAGYSPEHPFEYFFLDQRFNEQYHADEVQQTLLSKLAYICIFISLLGLLGLSAFTAAQRTKEIGIRKVHGASVPHIIYLLYKDIMVLVIIAAILIIPPTIYAIDGWMNNFAYRTTLDYPLFAVVAITALFFAFLTVTFHSLKTARTNPVDSLKYE